MGKTRPRRRRSKKIKKGPGYHGIFFDTPVRFDVSRGALTAKELCKQLREHGLTETYVRDGLVHVLPGPSKCQKSSVVASAKSA